MLKYPNEGKDSASQRKLQVIDKVSATDATISLSSLYADNNLFIESAERIGNQYHLYGRSSILHGVCPYCGTVCHKVHSRYVRTIRDLSILGLGVTIHFQARKFYCTNRNCSHRTFAEQPGTEIFRYRRRTRRCEVMVAQQSTSCSSNMASLMLNAMNILISGRTVLRDLHRITVPDIPSVRRIGIDDWAFRKGVTYGSLIIDLDTGAFLALLGDRGKDSFTNWLDRHPNVDMVSRDRSSDYSAAISSTQRDILEIADRFHLVKNLSEKISKLFNERYIEYKALVRPETLQFTATEQDNGPLLLPVSKTHDKRQVHFEEVKRLQSKGLSIKKISQKVGISKPTVIKYMHLDILPQRSHTARNPYHLYEERITREYLEEGKSLNKIREGLAAEGIRFGNTPFYEHFKYLIGIKQKVTEERLAADVDRKKRILSEEAKTPLLPPIAISMIVENYIRGRELKHSENELIETMSRLPWFNEICTAASIFYKIIKKAEVDKLRPWIQKYENSSISFLKSFIWGLKHDLKAIENALKYPVSNGILEGYVNKLKSIKRIMYGRAGIRLLAIKMYLAEGVFFN